MLTSRPAREITAIYVTHLIYLRPCIQTGFVIAISQDDVMQNG